MRQRRKQLFLGTLVCIGLSTGLAYPAFTAKVAEPGTAAASAVATQVMDLLAARSPGERPDGAQPGKVKLAKAPRSAASPVAKAREQEAAARSAGLLPSIVVPQSAPGATGQAGLPPEFMTADAAPVGVSDVLGPEQILPVGPLASGIPSDVILAALAPGGGGFGVAPGAGGNQPPPQPTIVTPVSAVPEPSTWLTMLIGFALVGQALRRARSARDTGFPLQAVMPARRADKSFV